MRVLVFFIIAFNIFQHLPAQPGLTQNAPSKQRIPDNLKFEHITIKEGLSHSIINCILKDSRGLMWFGTPAGLNVYDGQSFRTFKADKSGDHSLNSNMITCLAEDKNGIIWIGTDYGIITFDYRTEEFTRKAVEDNSEFYNISKIHIDGEGKIWITSCTGGLYQYNKDQNRIYKVNAQPHLNINDLVEDREGNLWLAGNSFTKFEKLQQRFTNIPYYISGIKGARDVEIKAIAQTDDGTIWLATLRNGLYKFDRSTQKFRQYDILPKTASLRKKGVTEYELNALETDEWNNIWIGTNQGLFIFDSTLTHSVQYKNQTEQAESLNSNEIRTIFFDSAVDLAWLGTLKGGINKCDLLRKEFYHLRFDANSPNTAELNDVTAIYEDSKGYLWIGTWTAGLIRYHRSSGSFKHIQLTDKGVTHLPSSNVAAINEDKFGNIWLASWRGYTTMIDANTKYSSALHFTNYNRDFHKHIGFEGWDFRGMSKDKNNNIWISAYDDGLLKVNHTGNASEPIRFTRYETGSDTHPLPFNRIWALHQDRSGVYWIGAEDGLIRLSDQSSNASIKLFKHDPSNKSSLSENSVRVILEDSHSNLWIGTGGGGLDKLDRKTGNFSHYDESYGLPNNMIYGILEDKNNNLWISTENGIAKFNTVTGDVRNFEENDGLQGNEFGIASYYKNPDTGEMFFGGTNGITSFYPERIKSNPYPPQILISDLRIFNKPVPVGKTIDDVVILEKNISETTDITLSYLHSVFSFDLNAVHYAAPEKNKVAYMLEGFDHEWIYVNNLKASATYTNLSAATYVFKVKGSNNDGLWSEPRSIRVTILPPFWETWWFRITLATAFILSTLGFLRLRIARIKKQKEELEKLVLQRTEEIKIQKEEIVEQTEKLSEQTIELTRMNNTLKENQAVLERQNTKIIEQMIKVKGMAMQLHDADEKKLQFFTNISHEIRTPLTLIIGPLQKIMQSPIKDCEKQLTLINTNVKRLSRLVDQVMDIRKLESGTINIRLSREDIVQFILKIKESFSFLAIEKSITLTFLCNQSRCIRFFDSDKLEKIIYNLLSNAFKFTPAGGKIIINSNIHFIDETECIEVTVSDTGIGIDEESIPRIFERFYQVQQVGHHENGIGVGLCLVKELVRLLHGNIEVRSTPGKGSSFTVIIPIKEKYSREEESIEKEYSQEESSFIDQILDNDAMPHIDRSLDSVVLLIVEDNKDIRTLIRETFESSCKVIEASNGMEGFETARNIIPDIIISDIMMPEMNGISFCKAIKELEATSHIPVVLLTARAHEDFQIKGLETGADDYIIKPFQPEILKLKIHNLIKARNTLKEKFCRQMILKPSDVSLESNDEVFIKKAIATIEEQISNPQFGVEAFCNAMNVSNIQLYRKLQALTGLSPVEFIKRIRLQRAIQLLSSDRFSVSEIAYQVGFNDPSYFIRCFKKHLGKTPGEYLSNQALGIRSR